MYDISIVFNTGGLFMGLNLFVFFSLFFYSHSYAANEARCVALGPNCIASEPLNTNTYTSASGVDYWNPGDTTATDKQARNDGVSGAAISEDSGRFAATPVNTGEAISALPAARTINWVLKQPSGGGGQSISTKYPTTSPTARRSLRFYRYYSPDHVWTGSSAPLCNSGKLLQLGWRGTFTGGPMISIFPGSVNMYDIAPDDPATPNTNESLGWDRKMQSDCCLKAPGSDVAGVTPPSSAQLRGKWWFVEFALNNAAPGGPSSYWEMWIRNVTDNQPEMKVIDSRIPMTSESNTPNFWWQSPMTDNLHVEAGKQITDFAINMFRSNNGSPCTGYIAHTSALWAAWDTSNGQRIGKACEVEGGCGTATNQLTKPERPRKLAP